MYLISNEQFQRLIGERTPNYVVDEIGRQITSVGSYVVTEYQLVQLSNSGMLSAEFISEIKNCYVSIDDKNDTNCKECTGYGGTCYLGSQCTNGLVDSDLNTVVCKNFYPKSARKDA